MKTAIIYTSKHGTTAKVAQMIAGRLTDSPVSLIDLKKDKHPDVRSFDGIILGTSIYASASSKTMQHEYAVFACFAGGEFLFEKMNFFERAVIKRIAKTDKSVSSIKEDEIVRFVTEFL
jgi:menaquinone-dependent protoporphyrinogen oxidase